MHPNGAFHVADELALLAAIDRIAFAHIVTRTPDGPMVVHAPLSMIGERPRFHVARANRIAAHLDGARVMASLVDRHGYISPNWYAAPGNQVPTWNYDAIELVGTVRSIDEAALVEQLDALAATHEPRVNPANPWTRDKMDDGRFRAMLRAIRGFEIIVESLRGTCKLGQNKSPADRLGAVAGLRAAGRDDLAGAMAAAG